MARSMARRSKNRSRHAGVGGGDDAVETEIGLGCEEGSWPYHQCRGWARSANRSRIGCGDQGVEIGEFAGKFSGTPHRQILPRLLRPAWMSCGRLLSSRRDLTDAGAEARDHGPDRR